MSCQLGNPHIQLLCLNYVHLHTKQTIKLICDGKQLDHQQSKLYYSEYIYYPIYRPIKHIKLQDVGYPYISMK